MGTVVITVAGGVAQTEATPTGVEVEIIDFDDLQDIADDQQELADFFANMTPTGKAFLQKHESKWYAILLAAYEAA